MQKFIFFDIDGTIWDENMVIPDSTAEALRLLRENGHRAFLCSGRARGNIRSEELLGLGFDGIVAACGNHVEMDGRILYERILPDEQVERAIRLLGECQMPVVLEGPRYHWIDERGFEEDPFVAYLLQALGDAAKPLRGFEPGIRINKFSGDILERTDYARLRRELGEEFDFLEHIGGPVVEFVPKGTSKATGIQWLCEHLGIAVEDTFGIGDSVNDLDMIRFVGHSIAMGNAAAPVKEAAEYVTSDIHQDGLLRALQHYRLI